MPVSLCLKSSSLIVFMVALGVAWLSASNSARVNPQASNAKIVWTWYENPLVGYYDGLGPGVGMTAELSHQGVGIALGSCGEEVTQGLQERVEWAAARVYNQPSE
jgi:hypothetical protein